jgi:hypothetical protein
VRQAARRSTVHRTGTPIETTINVRRTFSSGQEKSLLPAA